MQRFRVRFLGRKGELSSVMRQLGSASPEDRPRLGQLANTVKARVEKRFDLKKAELCAAAGKEKTSEDLLRQIFDTVEVP